MTYIGGYFPASWFGDWWQVWGEGVSLAYDPITIACTLPGVVTVAATYADAISVACTLPEPITVEVPL